MNAFVTFLMEKAAQALAAQSSQNFELIPEQGLIGLDRLISLQMGGSDLDPSMSEGSFLMGHSLMDDGHG